MHDFGVNVQLLAFDETALHVITLAFVTLGILLFALLAAALERCVSAMTVARHMRRQIPLLESETRSIGVAFLLAVVTGPIGAYAYLNDGRKFVLALITLNGLGAWWIESWFSVPQRVLIEQRRWFDAHTGSASGS